MQKVAENRTPYGPYTLFSSNLTWIAVFCLLFSVSALVGCENDETSEFEFYPTKGDSLGGVEVTITGSGFSQELKVLFGEIEAESVVYESAEKITAVTPQHPAGEVYISLDDSLGNRRVSDEPFVFENVLQVVSVQPDEGSVAGGTRVTLVGAGFTERVAVLFGGIAAKEVTYVNDRVVEVLTPSGRAGPVDIEVSVPGRPLTAVTDGFTYLSAEFTDFTPKSGPESGNTEVHIYGSGFAPDAEVFFGDVLAVETTYINETYLKALSPASDPGSVTLTLQTSGASLQSTEQFSYYPDTPDYSQDTPRVVSAAALDNVSVLVAFSEAMDDRAESVQTYHISTVSSQGTPTVLLVLDAAFVENDDGTEDRSRVELSTASQSAVTYTLRATDVADLDGQVFALPEISVGGAIVDPAVASFVGIPFSGQAEDSDDDGLPDHVEQLGWTVRVTQLNGAEVSRTVTSDPFNPDTDGDGMSDLSEKQWLTDPRLTDTDADELTDYQELNDILSSATRQDSDGDALPDGWEFNFFLTSPLLADTDGDQLSDDYELLLANRNARVADLPAPTIEVGETNLQLDVRFTEESALETRELETKNVTSTLMQSDKQEYSNMNSNTHEAFAKVSVGTSYKVEGSIFGPGGEFNSSIKVEGGWTGTWTSQHTSTSANETQQAYQDSLSTEQETRENAAVTREVLGALMQATVFVKNASDLGYRVQNLQVTAFIQDPLDPTSLTPLATLLPDAEPEDGYTLGPLVPERGPFIFSNDVIFPNLVESLMKNPRGLVFTISNFDIDDELGRNFAFSSQEVVERTALVIIDNGSFDSDGDGEGDLTEYHRVATSAGRVIDTNGDGNVDENDRRVAFGADGIPLGVTLEDALAAIGLTHYHYDDEGTPTETLTDREIENSYATIVDEAGVTRLFRVRGKALREGVPKSWEVMTPTGIDQTIDIGDFILTPNSDIRLVYVEDLDEDRIPANVEFLNNCSDNSADTDGDGIDDRTEVLLGWEVETGLGTKKVFTSCSLEDTDGDGMSDSEEAEGVADCDGDVDGIPETSFNQTDATSRDTDGDGIEDREEVCGFEVPLRTGGTIIATTDPTNPDTDGDTANDGLEKRLGGDPTNKNDRDDFADDDNDGLVNVQETEGWFIDVYPVSNAPSICDTVCEQSEPSSELVTSDPYNPDSDGDGLLDGEEALLGTNPGVSDTDNDGLTDYEEVRGIEVRDLGIIVLDPIDADTDNDKRSDGDEVKLGWIVWVKGEARYQVWSNPLEADEDFDTLVDGDEFDAGTDPTNYNTDGDKRDDAQEVALGLYPLWSQDFMVQQVTVEVLEFCCLKADDGEAGDDDDLEIDRFEIKVNGFNCVDKNDGDCESMYPEEQLIYQRAISDVDGEKFEKGTTKEALEEYKKDVTLEFNIDHYDFRYSKIYLWGYLREYDESSGEEHGDGETYILGHYFSFNDYMHDFRIIDTEEETFEFDVRIKIEIGDQVSCRDAETGAGQCDLP